MLIFDDHVTDIYMQDSFDAVSRAKTPGKIFKTKQGKMVIYNSFIASNFSDCPIAWHFCSAASTYKLEKVQEWI